MKKLFLILLIIFVSLFSTFALTNLQESTEKNLKSVFSNSVQNIDFFIKNIENVMLSTYEMNITSSILTSSQKEFIAKVYMLRNRAMFQGSIKEVEENKYTDKHSFNLAYSYLFGENYIFEDTSYQDVELGQLDFERFTFTSRNVVSFNIIDGKNIVDIVYETKLENKKVEYLAEYIIGDKNGMYYLIGFTINRIGDDRQ